MSGNGGNGGNVGGRFGRDGMRFGLNGKGMEWNMVHDSGSLECRTQFAVFGRLQYIAQKTGSIAST